MPLTRSFTQYIKSLKRSVRYDPNADAWEDTAGIWLDAQLPSGEEVRTSLRGRTASGMQYNDMLPVL